MRALYALSVAAITVIALMNWRFLEETRAKAPSPRSDLLQIVSGSYRSLLETMRWMPGNLRLYALMHVLAFLFNSLTGPYWVLYAADVQTISVIDWGSLLTISTLVQVVMTIPAGALIDRYDTRKITALAAGLSAIPILAFPFLRGFWSILISFTIISVANAFLMPAANAMMVELVPRERRGMVMAILGRGWLHTNIKEKIGGGPGMGFILTLPIVVGSLLSGYIYDAVPSAPWLLLGTSLMVNAIIAALFLKTKEEA
jgi:MFS family permease